MNLGQFKDPFEFSIKNRLKKIQNFDEVKQQ